MYLVFLLHNRSLICKFSVEKVVAGYLNTNGPFFFSVVVVVFFLRLFQPVFSTLALFRFVLRLSPWQPWQLGTPAKVLPLFYPLGRFERIKANLMGTKLNTPHTFIPGLVWQKQARPFSQFELEVGELGFLIHFVCVSAALYHRGHAAAIFSPKVNTVRCPTFGCCWDSASTVILVPHVFSPSFSFKKILQLKTNGLFICTFAALWDINSCNRSSIVSRSKLPKYRTALFAEGFFFVTYSHESSSESHTGGVVRRAHAGLSSRNQNFYYIQKKTHRNNSRKR